MSVRDEATSPIEFEPPRVPTPQPSPPKPNVFSKPEVHRAPAPEFVRLLRPTGIPPSDSEAHPPPDHDAPQPTSAQEHHIQQSLRGLSSASGGLLSSPSR